jgi:hypothetical protein
LSVGDQCIFENSGLGARELLLYDSRTGRLRRIPAPAARTNHQSFWVLLDGHLVRYSQCPSWQADSSNVAPSRPWFELYDWDGKCIRSSELMVDSRLAHWWVSFVSRTTNAIVFSHEGRPFTVEVPSLKITDRVHTAINGALRAKTVRAGNVTYEANGDIRIEKMAAEAEVREMSVAARDASTQRVLWKHNERVLIKRRK